MSAQGALIMNLRSNRAATESVGFTRTTSRRLLPVQAADHRKSPSAQLVTLQFASGGLRQLGDELDAARPFVVRQPAPDELLQRGGELRRTESPAGDAVDSRRQPEAEPTGVRGTVLGVLKKLLDGGWKLSAGWGSQNEFQHRWSQPGTPPNEGMKLTKLVAAHVWRTEVPPRPRGRRGRGRKQVQRQWTIMSRHSVR